MTRFIGMEYLAAAAFISTRKTRMKLSELSDYRIKVVRVLKEKELDAVLLFSNVYALKLVRDYSDCFELTDDDEVLKLKVPLDKLTSRFMNYLALDILDAFEEEMGKKRHR